MSVLCTVGPDDLLHGSEFVSEDYAGLIKMASERAVFDVSWDEVYKGLEAPSDAFVFYEYPTARVQGGDAYEADYANGTRVYYRSFRASLYKNLWL